MAGLVYQHVDGGDGTFGQMRYKTWDVTFDSSYPTNGELVDKSQVGLSNIIGAMHLGVADATSAGIVPIYKPSTGKLLAMRVTAVGTVAAPTFTGAAHTHTLNLKNAAVADGATTRVNAGTNLLGANTGADIAVAGNGANGGNANATAGGTNSAPAFTGTDSNLAEVANAVDLSAVTVRLMFLGN
jgi:hypothetical protein